MTTNDYFRICKPNKMPTHWAVRTAMQYKFDRETSVITNQNHLGLGNDLNDVPLIKLGWFDASEKPKEDGEYLIKFLHKNGDSTLCITTTFKDGKFCLDYDEKLLAWGYLPLFEQQKEPWEVAWEASGILPSTSPREAFRLCYQGCYRAAKEGSGE